MFVAINTKSMRVIAATPTVEQAEAHADIDAPEDNFIVIDYKEYDWRAFPQCALKKFYYQLTGKEFNVLDRDGQVLRIKQALLNVDADETPLAKLQAIRPDLPVVHAEGYLPGETVVLNRKVPTPSAPVKQGSNKQTTFELMNAKWEAAGKPSNVSKMRIELMNEMGESHPYINRGSISNTLAKWVKENIQ